MHDEFEFMIAGIPVMLSFRELDKAMQHQMYCEVVDIENKIVSVFDTKQGTCLGRMKVHDAVEKFG
jgi:hypothetical protein